MKQEKMQKVFNLFLIFSGLHRYKPTVLMHFTVQMGSYLPEKELRYLRTIQVCYSARVRATLYVAIEFGLYHLIRN